MNENYQEKMTLYFIKNGDIHLTQEKTTSSEIQLKNIIEKDYQPLKISVETSTDWPIVIATLIVGIGSILTTCFVARISYINQRVQISSNIATFRQKWQEELRNTTAEYFSHASQIYHNKTENGLSISPADNGELTRLHAKLELLFDKEKYKDIESLIERVTNLAISGSDGFYAELNSLHYAINIVLEKAWGDIKNDLRGISPD
ncbi:MULTISPECIES: hypothetical protein [Aeromonas]|jgi:hypothetical protein|uniref:hypothetical protein n=1 Tax=Aeromonas TaxID=642 RepID=UPI001146E197|nr:MULTISPECIES: hypothetical protein [Aeromonas]